jgi:hypothetical protein
VNSGQSLKHCVDEETVTKFFFVQKRDNEKFNSPYLIISFIYVAVGAQIILFYFGGTQIIFVFCFEGRKQISGHLVVLY